MFKVSEFKNENLNKTWSNLLNWLFKILQSFTVLPKFHGPEPISRITWHLQFLKNYEENTHFEESINTYRIRMLTVF